MVGAGYVGLVTAAGIAAKRPVRLVDISENRIEELQAGGTPIFEPGLDEALNECRREGMLSFFTDLGQALEDGQTNLVFVTVGTPPRSADEGEGADLSSVNEVLGIVAGRPGTAVVMKSTVPPEAGRRAVARFRERGTDLNYISCPEFLREGQALTDFRQPDRIVVGFESGSWASDELRDLHEELYEEALGAEFDDRYVEMKTTAAELVKHSSNLMLAIRISYANEIANLAEEVDADAAEVLSAVGMDVRIGDEFLEPGVGFGGSCFDKDVRAVRHEAIQRGLPLHLADAVLAVNERQAQRVALKLENRLGSLSGRRIALLGLAFKPDTDDVRNSPAFAIAGHLRAAGATVSAWDPNEGARSNAVEPQLAGIGTARSTERTAGPTAPPRRLAQAELAETPIDAVRAADAVVLVTDWQEFRELDWSEVKEEMNGDLVLDGRNALPIETIQSSGLVYEGTGRMSGGLRRSRNK